VGDEANEPTVPGELGETTTAGRDSWPIFELPLLYHVKAPRAGSVAHSRTAEFPPRGAFICP